MPQLDPVKALFISQLFWLAVTFGLLYLFIAFFVTPRIESVLNLRKTMVRDDLDKSDTLRLQTQNMIESYELSVAASKKDALAKIEQARAKFTSEADVAKSTHGAHLAAQLAGADAKLSAQREAAMASIQEMAADLTSEIIQKISGVKETAKAINAAIKAT